MNIQSNGASASPIPAPAASPAPRAASVTASPERSPGTLPTWASDRRGSPRTLDAAVKALNAHLDEHHVEAHYSIDQNLHAIVVKLINPDSGEVLQQFPNEAAIRMAAALAKPGPPPHLLDQKG